MPYNDIEKRREANRHRSSQKVDVVCEICSSVYKIRRDTSYKKYKRVCLNCIGNYISKRNSTKINEDKFVHDYLHSDMGYQTLCKKYHIGDRRGKKILLKNNVKLFRKPVWNKGTAKKKKCKVCGDEFIFRKNAREIYCSKACQIKDGEWIETQRKNTIRQIKQGKFQNMDTSIEKVVESILKKLELTYEKQFIVGYWAFDFYINACKILIEADGDYWHGNPKFYTDLNDMQKRNSQRQKRKDNCAIERGFKILHFWENDINNNMDVVENAILQNCR